LSAIAIDPKNGSIVRVCDFTLAVLAVYAGLFIDRCERAANGQMLYVFRDESGEIAQLEKEFTDDFTVAAKAFSDATRVVWNCQHQLRQREHRERD
jgi:hypothetical protein